MWPNQSHLRTLNFLNHSRADLVAVDVAWWLMICLVAVYVNFSCCNLIFGLDMLSDMFGGCLCKLFML